MFDNRKDAEICSTQEELHPEKGLLQSLEALFLTKQYQLILKQYLLQTFYDFINDRDLNFFSQITVVRKLLSLM